MVPITVHYPGALLCEAKHLPSSATLRTDAPADIGGGASSFSPTDLVATALATCMATTMDMVAKRNGLDLSGMRVDVTKEMTSAPPRRIKRLATHIHLPIHQGQDPQGQLQRAAHNCPVARSLHAEIEVPVVFHWKE